jgi:catechol 2,3-dioxygenase-like lactoylglutathione lyase family enzyme
LPETHTGKHGASPRTTHGDRLPSARSAVDDIDAAVAAVRARGGELVGEVENYQDMHRFCYIRGPDGIIVELAERIGQ